MKHIFVINPAAGKGKSLGMIRPKIQEYCTQHGLDYHIYVTARAEDGMEFVRSMAKSGEHMRIYACGGDGTIYEVVNGAYGFDNVEIAAIPLGSGNDFIRIFGKREDFLDIDVHVNGTPTKLDAILCGGRVAVNQCSMGLDAEICAKQANFKKLPAMNGESAYTASLAYCIMKKLDSRFTVKVDGNEPFTSDVLFCLCGNARWYGGGYMGAPRAIPDDGLLDFIIVRRDMSRFRLFSLVNDYKNGRHLSWDRTTFIRGKRLEITSEKPAAVNVDGECEYVTHSVFEIAEKAVNFVVPLNSTYFEDMRRDREAEEKGRYDK